MKELIEMIEMIEMVEMVEMIEMIEIVAIQLFEVLKGRMGCEEVQQRHHLQPKEKKY